MISLHELLSLSQSPSVPTLMFSYSELHEAYSETRLFTPNTFSMELKAPAVIYYVSTTVHRELPTFRMTSPISNQLSVITIRLQHP